jgi:hypothetical protein
MGKRNTRPDTADYRDRLYQPSLVNVPRERPLASYRRFQLPVLNQGTEGACTGFGLAGVANYLLRTQVGGFNDDFKPVSSRMFYEMAKLHDEWPGSDYEGSSCRAAVKGWHRYGVCRETEWPYEVGAGEHSAPAGAMEAARLNPLGAYLRVNSNSLVDMHAAMTEAGVLYVSAETHSGWDGLSGDAIPYSKGNTLAGGHAFALVGYDSKGFWIQNSWGEAWGDDGCARISYADWLAHGTDVWVCRLGVPVSA